MPKKHLVTIGKEYTNPETIPQLLRYQPWAETFARKHGISMVLHAPDGACPATEQDGAVHVYFFAYPVEDPYWPLPSEPRKSARTTKSVYGFTLPTVMGGMMGMPQESEVSLRWNEQGLSIGKAIRSPEEQMIARTIQNHIWILFNIAARAWEGDRVVFERILEDAAQWLLPAARLSRSPRRLARIARVLHRHIDREEMIDDFIGMASSTARNAVDMFSEKQEKALDEHEKIGEALVEKALEAEIAAMALEKITSSMTALDADFATEFEQMLSWETIRGIRVENNVLKISTYLISMKDEKNPSARVPLGEFVISISPLENDTKENNVIKNIAIYPREGAWRGPWLHPEVRTGSDKICFGSGFNEAVWKLFQERKLKDLVHTLLTFLMIDARSPHKRSVAEPMGENAYAPPDKPFYADDADRTACRNAYVALARESFQRLSGDSLKEKMEKLRKEESDLIQKFCASRERWRTLMRLCNAAKAFADSEELWKEELEMLLGEGSLYELYFGEGWMRAHFALATRDGAADLGVFIWPVKNRIEITNAGLRADALVIGKNGQQMFNFKLHKKAEIRILHLMAAGYLGSAIALILKIARGADQNLVASEASERLYAYRAETEVIYE